MALGMDPEKDNTAAVSLTRDVQENFLPEQMDKDPVKNKARRRSLRLAFRAQPRGRVCCKPYG
jgi:hypothetical protein